MSDGKNTLIEAALASLVAGAALAAGAELWGFLSPKQRRERDQETLKELQVEIEEEL